MRAGARAALRMGDAGRLKALMEAGDGTFEELIRELHLHQVELEMQAEQLRQTNARLEQSMARFRGLWDVLPHPALVVDGIGRILDANATARTTLGLASTSALRKPLIQGLLPLNAERARVHEALRGAASDGRAVLREVRMSAGPDSLCSMDLWIEHLTDWDDSGESRFLVQCVDQTEVHALGRRFRGIVDGVTDAIISIDRQQRIRLINPAAERLLGYGADEVLGTPLERLLPPEQREHPARMVEEFVRGLRGAERMGGGRRLEALRADGERVAVEASISRLAGGSEGEDLLTVVLRDVGERDRALMALEESEARFRQVTESMDEIFWLFDVDRREMLYVSPAYRRLWPGLRPAGGVPDLGDLLHAVPMEERRSLVRLLHPERVDRRIEHRVVTDDGEVRWLSQRSVVVENVSGSGRRLAGVAADITERRAWEQERSRQEKLAALGQLTGGVAHDFNNLLTVVLGNAEVLEEELRDDADLHGVTRGIRDAALRGAELVQRLLGFAQRRPLLPRPVSANGLLEGLEALVSHTLGGEVEVRVLPAAGEPVMMVDAGMLETALLNLCLNARDAMPDGGRVTVSCDTVQAAVDGGENGAFVRMSVEDTGIGIADEVIGRIFDPFFTTKELGRGTGMGLAMVYGFVKQSRGEIRVASTVGEGTRFDLLIPRSFEAPEPPPRARPRALRGNGERILVVEDEPEVREHIMRHLRALGYEVVGEETGRGGAHRIETDHSIDLLCTDVMLPGGMNGGELAALCARVRPEVPVVFISGYSQDVLVEQGRLAHGVRLLEKPFSREGLAEMVRQALSKPA